MGFPSSEAMILFMAKRLFDMPRVEHVPGYQENRAAQIAHRRSCQLDQSMLAEHWRRFRCEARHMENSGTGLHRLQNELDVLVLGWEPAAVIRTDIVP